MNKLLLIDRDGERARRLAMRLRLRGFNCDIADSYLYALTMLEWRRPAAILVREELRIDGMTAAEFCAVVKQDDALRNIMLARAAGATVRRTTAISRFDLELDDGDSDLLATRLAEAVGTAGRTPAGADDRLAFAAADGAESAQAGFLSMLEVLSMKLSSGRITLRGDRRLDPIYVLLDHGQIVHAVFGGLQGVPAFRRLIEALNRGEDISYRFEPVPRWKLSTFPRSIRLADRQRLFEERSAESDFSTQDLAVPIRRADRRET